MLLAIRDEAIALTNELIVEPVLEAVLMPAHVELLVPSAVYPSVLEVVVVKSDVAGGSATAVVLAAAAAAAAVIVVTMEFGAIEPELVMMGSAWLLEMNGGIVSFPARRKWYRRPCG